MEFISLAVLGILIVISPGADFVLVLKNSLNLGRKAGIWTAMGVSLAICVHIGYSMLGISYLISQNEWLYSLVKYAGSAYLIYLGLKGIFSASADLDTLEFSQKEIRPVQYLAQGFLCNVLNPKTMLFFLSIFSQVISPDSSDNYTALGYGFYMVILHGLWFGAVAILFTSQALQAQLLRVKKRLNQACGAGLFAFGALLAVKS
ncbi:LysE family translocator [Photobacterium sp. SDRW27]|uniref:LysE family translocator n=1 Tax=Photobacterium obscurum TaxID=2829490 RepID=UPI002243E326|nr:LysE family translocator [Photobacterium obscurum]MCW8328739.1 LysE family translocator [Photobacterium obscurum]